MLVLGIIVSCSHRDRVVKFYTLDIQKYAYGTGGLRQLCII
jgi:hypothetical protein